MPKTKPITKAKARAIAKAKAQQKEKRKKFIMAGVIGLGVIILLIVLLTRLENAVKQAETFLALLGDDKITDAYQSTARPFQDSKSEEDFKTIVENNGLTRFASVTWAKPNIAKDQAKLQGLVTTKTGEKIPLEVTLLLIGRQWKVFRLDVTSPGIAVNPPGTAPAATTPGSTAPTTTGPVASPFGSPSVPIPGDEEMKSLVFDALYNLQQAVDKKDFNSFYGYISQQWQKETSTDNLKKKYQGLIDKKFERAVFVGNHPVFDQSPYVGTDNSITIMGHYPTEPLKVAFELQYVHENSFWKLSAADIKLTEDPSSIGRLPGPAELRKLVTATLLVLNDAITSKNFSPFYHTLAKEWQQQSTPEQLQAKFQEYIDKKFDFKKISETDPVFTTNPDLNMENQFSVSGSYEVKDLKVDFQIPYHFEDSSWKPLPFFIRVKMIPLKNSGTTNP
jgi:hypothetical protein